MAQTEKSPTDARKQVTLTVEYGEPDFRWQMFFNAFAFERKDSGVMAKVAYVDRGAAAEIVQVFVSDEGLQNLKESSTRYIQDFAGVLATEMAPLPNAKTFSPMFSNHVRLARSGSSAEISFFTVPLIAIATAASGKADSGKDKQNIARCVQVALLHSDVPTHAQFVMNLIAFAK